MSATTTADGRPAERSFEPWMLANFAMGAGFSAFIALLVPAFVTEVTGQASAAGVVMAIISLAAVLGPVLGTFADKYRAHRIVMSGGIVFMAVGFGLFAGASEQGELYALDAIILGVSLAAISAVGPVLIVGAGLDRELEAKRMTAYSLAMPAGQVVGGLLITAAANANWSYTGRFWIAAAFSGLLAVVVWFTSKGPEARLHEAMDELGRGEATKEPQAGLGQVLFSGFGLFLLVMVLSSIANNGINNQISNILPQVYGISETGTSTLISVAGLLNIALFIPAGAWMAKRGAFEVFVAGNATRLVGALGLAVVGAATDNAVILGAAFMQIVYQSNPFVRLTQPSVGVGLARFPAGAASGWIIAASALGSFGGSIIGGFLADAHGFNSINWMATVSAGTSVVLLVLVLAPLVRRSDTAPEPEHPDDHAVAARGSRAGRADDTT